MIRRWIKRVVCLLRAHEMSNRLVLVRDDGLPLVFYQRHCIRCERIFWDHPTIGERR
jgi:hypothetical protein